MIGMLIALLLVSRGNDPKHSPANAPERSDNDQAAMLASTHDTLQAAPANTDTAVFANASLVARIETTRKLSDVLDETAPCALPDITAYEQPFDAVVSLKPLLTHTIGKLTYSMTLNMSGYNVQDADVDMSPDPKRVIFMPNGEKELVFDKESAEDSDQDVVRYVENVSFPRMPKASLNRAVSVAGNHIGPQGDSGTTPMGAGTCQELDPKFPTTALRKGDEWVQRFSVDPTLNPSGTVEATLKVAATYAKDGERFMRVERSYGYKTHPPSLMKAAMAAARWSKRSAGDGGSEKTVDVRFNEVFDIAVDRGIVLQKQTDVTTYLNGFGLIDGVNGLLQRVSSVETLSGVFDNEGHRILLGER
jgi:hypothetical protein